MLFCRRGGGGAGSLLSTRAQAFTRSVHCDNQASMTQFVRVPFIHLMSHHSPPTRGKSRIWMYAKLSVYILFWGSKFSDVHSIPFVVGELEACLALAFKLSHILFIVTDQNALQSLHWHSFCECAHCVSTQQRPRGRSPFNPKKVTFCDNLNVEGRVDVYWKQT